MRSSKRIFFGIGLLFVLLLAYASWDISQRTTFPGSKSQLKERLKKNYLQPDSAKKDSAVVSQGRR